MTEEARDDEDEHKDERFSQGGHVVFLSRQGWYFEVIGADVRSITAVSWEGADLDINDFIEQLGEVEVEALDALLQESWREFGHTERDRIKREIKKTKNVKPK